MTNGHTVEDRYDDDEPSPTPAPTNPAEWDGLIGEWDEMRHGYYLGNAPDTVLECAKNLEASVAAGGPDTALWTLGMVLIGPYVIHARPDAAAEARVLEAMAAVERALGQTSCGHEAHPCDDMPLDAELDNFRHVLKMLAHPERDATSQADPADEEDWPDEMAQSWYDGRMTREIWACPRNLAGFARAFSD
ncbi:hypothetical protein OIE63_38860 [Streptomyces sp. NBC_01795]|uniref:hypothetical protein n=1 Tax=Streptomyces sp. NBC_01795 TaxID=2975943 RepID=UPI002DDC5DE4|nr:hypothetical protein [Streptomyces sp. NBC_01795]WSA96855.1 hypothetical protein OIE63_38860 [Streptomyces sp. NBC_01795]